MAAKRFKTFSLSIEGFTNPCSSENLFYLRHFSVRQSSADLIELSEERFLPQGRAERSIFDMSKHLPSAAK